MAIIRACLFGRTCLPRPVYEAGISAATLAPKSGVLALRPVCDSLTSAVRLAGRPRGCRVLSAAS